MKRISQMLLVVALCCLLNSNAVAQDNQGHYYTVTTWKISIPEDGSRKEFNALMQEWTDKIVKKNDKVLSERVLRHDNGSDSRDVIIITEYASWNDIDAAQKTQSTLVKAAWPDGAFMKKFNRYSVSHSDEICREIAALRK